MYKVKDLKKVKGYFTDINAQDGWDAWLKLKNKNKLLSFKVSNILLPTNILHFDKKKKIYLKKEVKYLIKWLKIIKILNKKLQPSFL